MKGDEDCRRKGRGKRRGQLRVNKQREADEGQRRARGKGKE